MYLEITQVFISMCVYACTCACALCLCLCVCIIIWVEWTRIWLHRYTRTDKVFLRFFFRRLRANDTGRYESDFPFYSPCGEEINYVHCDDLPVVFSQLSMPGDVPQSSTSTPSRPRARKSQSTAASEIPQLWYGSDNHQVLSVDFVPSSLFMLPGTGRVYHAAPERLGGIGLVKSSLAIEFGKSFTYEESADPETDYPIGFKFQDTVHHLDNKFAKHFLYEE